MKTASLMTLGALLCLASGPAAFAQGTTLYTPNTDLSTGTQNPWVGSAGGVFTTTSDQSPTVGWLGYYDKDGDGLANAHEVSLWYIAGNGGSTAAEVARVTIPAGSGAMLVDGYRWVQLSSPVVMWYGSWYTLAAQTDNVDTWGDLISGNQIAWNPYFTAGTEDWTRAGRTDTADSWPNSPIFQSETPNSIYPVANLAFGIPEPTTLAILALGASALAFRSRKQK